MNCDVESFTEPSRLQALQLKIDDEIRRLAPTDPTTLATYHDGGSIDGDTQVRRIVERICREESEELKCRIRDEYFAAGPLEPLFQDASVTEIMVNGPDSIWFEKNGTLHRLSDQFLSSLNYRNFIARMSREAGIHASLDCPFADGLWRQSRVHLIIPPASGDEAVVTLRRHPANPWTFDSLRSHDWASDHAIKSLNELLVSRANFLVIGCTGSGKTSVLNACLSTLKPEERTVIIEDTDELAPPSPLSVKLLTRRDPHGHLREINQSELLRQALRMRPDRIIMGEIRGGEAKDLLMAFATGHAGSLGTLHAESARQALLRLEMLVQLGAPQWNLQAVRTLIWLSIQAIVVVTKTKTGKRELEGIYKISSLEEIGFLLEKLT